MAITIPSRPRHGVITPLSVIALFLSLTEVVLGVGVIQTSGGIQAWLTGFVMVFPAVIAAGFFTILWRKAYVLYPPTEYGQGTDVSTFVTALQGLTGVAAAAAGQATPPTPDAAPTAPAAGALNDVANLQQEIASLREQLRIGGNSLFFERFYRLAYGSQLAFMNMLQGRANAGVAEDEATPFFNFHQSSVAALPGAAVPDREAYFGFLLNAQVVRRENGRYYLTEAGLNYLAYAAAAPLPYWLRPY